MLKFLRQNLSTSCNVPVLSIDSIYFSGIEKGSTSVPECAYHAIFSRVQVVESKKSLKLEIRCSFVLLKLVYIDIYRYCLIT